MFKHCRFLILILSMIPMPGFSAIMDPYVSNATASADLKPIVTMNWSSVQVARNNNVVPCSYQSQCLYGVMIYHTSESGALRVSYPWGAMQASTKVIDVKPGMTWSEAASEFIARYGASGALDWEWTWRPDFWQVCIGAASGVSAKSGPPLIGEPNSCRTIPKVPVSCSADGMAEIDHGRLEQNNVNGNKASTQLRLQCTAPSLVTVHITPAEINLGGGIISVLTVNGAKDGGNITADKDTVLTFESELKAVNPSTGFYTGIAMVYFSVQ